MDFVNFVMALSPILVVLVGILGFKQSAKRVSPIALVWTLILAFTYFNVTGASFADNVKTLDPLVWKGIKEGLKIVLMVFGAFTILNLLRETGAIDDVKSTIARISDDRRVQVVVIGMMLPIFLEGAAGAGAPAAIAAPFLVALGFDPVTSIAVALLGDATPCLLGRRGSDDHQRRRGARGRGTSPPLRSTRRWSAASTCSACSSFRSSWSAWPSAKRASRASVPYLCFAGVSTCAVMFVLSNFVGAEVTSMGTGLISMLLSRRLCQARRRQDAGGIPPPRRRAAAQIQRVPRHVALHLYARAAAARALRLPGGRAQRLRRHVYVRLHRLGGRRHPRLRHARRG